MRRILISAVVLCLTAATTGAHAAEAKKDKAAASGLDVNMAPVAVPVLFNGRVVNYIFVTLRLTLSHAGDPIKLREKEPYFRDALVRLASRTPLNQPNDLSQINEPVLRSSLLAQCAKIVGPGLVTGMVIVKQASQHEAWTLPKAAPAGGKSPPHP